jgi:hypothetical protein
MALWILPKRGLLCVGAKANVPLCGGKKLNKKMCGGEKKKYRRVGKVCRLSSCPFVIWSVCLCLSVKMVYASLVCPSVTVRVARSVFTLAANVFGLCVRAGFGAQNCQPALHLIRSTKLQVCTSPRLTQNPCVCPAWASDIEDIKLFQRVKVPYVRG